MAKQFKYAGLFLTLLLINPTPCRASLNEGIEVGTSVAHSYEARSIFTNPAALSYQTELNGAGLLSSFNYASTFDKRGEFSLGVSYGYLGLGVESLVTTDQFYRYRFGFSFPIFSTVFIGSRFSTTSSSNNNLSGIHSWDFGLQYRALSFLSFGLFAKELNRPTISGVRVPIQYDAGIVLRPLDKLELSFDAETLSNNFASDFTYQTNLRYSIFDGLQLLAGYHSENRIQVGLSIDLARARLFSTVQPDPKIAVKDTNPRFTIGFQTSLLPHKSVITPTSALVLKIDEHLSEEGVEGNLFTEYHPSLLDLLTTLKAAETDESVKTVLLKIEHFPLGLAAAEELVEALSSVKKSGKKIIAHLQHAQLKEYLIASIAHEIHLDPSGEITIIGPRSQRYYLKGTLDKIGVSGDFLARGEYKSAPETFNRTSASPKSLEAIHYQLKKVEEELLRILKSTRNIQLADWEKITQHVVFDSGDAIKFKLIESSTAYPKLIETHRKNSLLRAGLKQNRNALSLPERVAVIVAEGDILQKRRRLLALSGGNQLTPEKLSGLFKRASQDPTVKAIVLRVDSPGGEVLASHQMATLIEETSQKMPVVISMGDVAASGGYMLAAPATRIFADRLTLTGSIGVFLGKVNLGELYKKISLHKEIIGRTPFAGIDSESRAWSPAETAVMNRRLNQYYDGFIEFVSLKRKISKTDSEKAAKGRVWLGSDALNLKLIDEEGGLMKAIHESSKLAGLKSSYEIFQLHESIGLIESLTSNSLLAQQQNSFGLLEAIVTPEFVRQFKWIESLKETPFLYLATDADIR